MDHEHERAVVLADDTRYGIYRFIAESPGVAFTVAEVAARFGVHPNVARMHLNKLKQAGFLGTDLRRVKGGGRPAKLYSLGARVASFAFPPRRYDLLSSLALAALAEGGDRGDVQRVCREAGCDEGYQFLSEATDGWPSDKQRSLAALLAITESQGLLATAEWRGDELEIEVHNCVFGELSALRPELVCVMHRAFLEGMLGVVMAGAGKVTFSVADETMSCGADCCRWTCLFDGKMSSQG